MTHTIETDAVLILANKTFKQETLKQILQHNKHQNSCKKYLRVYIDRYLKHRQVFLSKNATFISPKANTKQSVERQIKGLEQESRSAA